MVESSGIDKHGDSFSQEKGEGKILIRQGGTYLDPTTREKRKLTLYSLSDW